MEGVKEKKENVVKSIFKKMLIPILLIVVLLIIFMGSIFSVFKGDIEDFTEAQQEYRELLEASEDGISLNNIDSNFTKNPRLEVPGIQVAAVIKNQNRYNRIARMEETSVQKISDQYYNLSKEIILRQQKIAAITDRVLEEAKVETKSKAEEIAGELSFLGNYIQDSSTQTKEQKLAYLMNSEVVTMFPYIESIDGDEAKLNGTIRFYRYLNTVEDGEGETDLEKIQLTFINKDNFEKKFEEYRTSGNQDVLKYFTLDENKDVVIAYGTVETKTITTTDNELTLEKVNEISTQTYVKKGEGVYESITYTVDKKPIDYQSYVEQYVLPFNFLATLLVQTRDYNLVKEIADLAYDSEIAIGIYDNKSITENTEEYTYNKKIKYTENTELVFDNINTDPKVNISSNRYSDVVKECFGKLNDTKENSIHCSGIELEDLETATGNRADGKVHEAYISEILADGTITGITSEAHEFKTIFNIKTVANSAPTVDIAIADIWAGKYTSTYVAEPNNSPPESSTYNLEDEELLSIDTNKFANEILKIDGEIGKNLKEHSENLRRLAIEKIIEKTETDFKVNPRSMALNDISTHANTCDECKAALKSKYGLFWSIQIKRNENLLNEVETLEELVTIKQHVEEALQNEADAKTEERKQKFITDINSAGQVTYNQWPTTYKANTSIVNTRTSSRISSTYKKDSTVTEGLGEKFADILSDDKYYESRQAILAREEWIWDALKDNEATANIENLIRYLFNIAFDTEEFGTFTTEDINGLFKMFEPQNTTRIRTIYGETLETKIWYALSQQGYSAYAIAGVLGNLWVESGIRSNNLENSYESRLGYNDETYTEAINNGSYSREQFISDHNNNNCGAGYGLAQWTYYTRKAGLYDFARSKGVGIDDENMQIEYLIGEITPSGGADGYADNALSAYNGYTTDDWISAESPEDAAVAFCWIFEKPGTPNMSTRTEKAREYYEKYKDFEGLGGVFEKNTSDDKKIIGNFTSSITGRTFTIIKQSQIKYWDVNNNGKQDDYDWDSGCNRATQVSVCSGYWSESIDELIIEVAKAGSGVAPCYQKTYNECGLSYSYQELTGTWTFDENKIREQVQNGGYVALYLRGSWMEESGYSKTDPDTKWANKAHWVAILGYREIEGNEEIFVSDSGHENSGWWPINEFDGIINNVVFVNEK